MVKHKPNYIGQNSLYPSILTKTNILVKKNLISKYFYHVFIISCAKDREYICLSKIPNNI